MKLKYIFFLFFLSSPFCVEGRTIQKPRMPYRLSANKKETPIVKQHIFIASNKKPKRKGIQGYRHFKTFSQMDYHELQEVKETHKIAKNYDLAIKYLERMIILCDNVNEKAVLIIELADLFFDQKKYELAAKWYGDFCQLYPGNKHLEYASYRAIVCTSKNILSIDRDQSPTEKTLDLATAFLKRSDIFTMYSKEVAEIQHQCQQTLALSDCNVAQFYLQQGHYSSAKKRLSSIRKEWVETVPEIVTTLAHLEVNLSEQNNDFNAPESSIKLAQATNSVKKTDMTARF